MEAVVVFDSEKFDPMLNKNMSISSFSNIRTYGLSSTGRYDMNFLITRG